MTTGILITKLSLLTLLAGYAVIKFIRYTKVNQPTKLKLKG